MHIHFQYARCGSGEDNALVESGQQGELASPVSTSPSFHQRVLIFVLSGTMNAVALGWGRVDYYTRP